MSGREVGLVLVSPLLRSRLSAADRRKLPKAATFAIVERTGTGDDWSCVLHASDLDVPRGETPEVFGKRISDRRGAVDLSVQRDLVYRLTESGWVAWDSLARFEERPLPAGCRFPTPGEAGDFVIRAKQTVEVAA